LARRTWAKSVTEETATERAEAIDTVAGLNDNLAMLTGIVRAWQVGARLYSRLDLAYMLSPRARSTQRALPRRATCLTVSPQTTSSPALTPPAVWRAVVGAHTDALNGEAADRQVQGHPRAG
jgi:hypothetical protein